MTYANFMSFFFVLMPIRVIASDKILKVKNIITHIIGVLSYKYVK